MSNGRMDCVPVILIIYIICIAIFVNRGILNSGEIMSQTEMISLRMSAEQKGVIDAAAEACGRSRTAFIVESAVRQARDMLLDRRDFVLDARQWDEFMALLDGPVDSPAMKRTMETPPPWKED